VYKKIKLQIKLAIIFLIFLVITMPIKKMASNNTPSISISDGWSPIKILTANVGNVDYSCRGKYNYKLCKVEVENKIKENISKINPDIVFLQELLHPSQCERWNEKSIKKVCHKNHNNKIPNQARRILGDNYSILCAARVKEDSTYPRGMECIAVNVAKGEIEGCPKGELCFSTENSDMPGNKCNPEFIIMTTFAKINGVKIKLINAHPDSLSKYCRDHSLSQIFSSLTDEKAIIAGDFNFDPFNDKENSPIIWQQQVGSNNSRKPFHYHSGISEASPPYPTAYFLLQRKTIDHVVSNFAIGKCKTLGEAPGTTRLDGGKGMDHRAILCELWIP
jgi:endonuclease/exonuclease/phosphatase family metal-dependent hydrolase